jgi:DNA-binding NarL/FixJ family response regulator
MITVAELIEKLKQHNPDARIIISAEDAGYNDIASVVDLKVTQSNYRSRYKGTLAVPKKDTDILFDAVLLKI